MSDKEESEQFMVDEELTDVEETDEDHTDDGSLYTETDSDDIDYDLTDEEEPALPDITHLIESQKTWHQLSDEEKFQVWYQMVALSATVDTKIKVLHRFGEDMLLEENEELLIDTALHHADNKALAQLILESVDPSKRERLLLRLDQDNHSVLHVASMMGRTDVVEYLLSFGVDENKLLLIHDRACYGEEFGNTALHFAGNKQIAQLLVNAVGSGKREEFVWAYSDKQYTPLHQACREGKADVVGYLLSLCTPQNKWDNLLGHYREGYTPLHCAKTSEIAKMLIVTAKQDGSEEKLEDFVLAREVISGESVLHTASRKGRADVVLYLVALEPFGKQLLATKDTHNNTPLHMAHDAEVAEAIMDAIDEADRFKYIAQVNETNQTVLHYSSQHGRISVIQHFLKSVYDTMFSDQDNEGNTPLLLAVDGAHATTVSQILEYFSGNVQKLKEPLLHTNEEGQNVFHLAGRHCNTDIDEVLKEYEDQLSPHELTALDVIGNSPLHYLTGTQKLKAFADQIMRLPLAMRRELFLAISNQNKLTGGAILDKIQTIESPDSIEHFFFQSVMNKEEADMTDLNSFYEMRRGDTHGQPHYEPKFEPRIWTVKSYALHEYSLTDAASTALLQSDTNLQNPQVNPWLFIDDVKIDETSGTRSYQQALRNMDTVDQHGFPKVVIGRKVDKVLHIIPPGPDYIIITATFNRFRSPENVPSWPDESLPTNDIGEVIEVLRHDDSVDHVTVNSTLGKHYVAESVRLCEKTQTFGASTHHVIDGENRGRALILCNKKGRDGWEFQYNDAVFILKEQFGLKVTSLYDLTADQMVEEIISFSNSPGHGQIAALVIMSHGDCDGNISGVDGKPLAVQRVVKEFCSIDLDNIPKVVILSFCRGGIPSVYNRLTNAYEVTQLPEILDSSAFAPSKKPLPPRLRRKEHKIHPFPEVEIPVNCHLYYTTLPDSKAPQEGIVFKTMREYINSIGQLGAFHRRESTDKLPKKQGNTFETPSEKYRKLETRPQVELVKMFSDIAGEVREKSQFKVYTNHCYTVNKDSEPIVIEILDT